jgi:hypothetical protein
MTKELWMVHYEVLLEDGKPSKNGFVFYELTYSTFEDARKSWEELPKHIAKNANLGQWCTVAFTNCVRIASEQIVSVTDDLRQQADLQQQALQQAEREHLMEQHDQTNQ